MLQCVLRCALQYLSRTPRRDLFMRVALSVAVYAASLLHPQKRLIHYMFQCVLQRTMQSLSHDPKRDSSMCVAACVAVCVPVCVVFSRSHTQRKRSIQMKRAYDTSRKHSPKSRDFGEYFHDVS